VFQGEHSHNANNMLFTLKIILALHIFKSVSPVFNGYLGQYKANLFTLTDNFQLILML